jgi:hypothetical protein
MYKTWNIEPSYTKMKNQHFEKEPEKILDIFNEIA